VTDVNKFVSYIRDILNALDHDIELENKHKYFKILWHNDQLLAFPHSVTLSYNNAISMLVGKADVRKRLVSRSHIENTFNNFLSDLYDYKSNNNEPSLTSILHGKVQEFFKAIRNLKAFEYLVIIPILNMKIEQIMIIGNVEFVNLTPEKIKELRNKHNINAMPEYNENEREIVKDFQGDSRHPTAGIDIVISSDSTKAEELAVQTVDQALNVLRFYFHSFRGRVRGEELREVNRTILISNIDEKQDFSPSSELCNMIDPDYPDEVIDNETLRLLRNNEIDKLNRILIRPFTELSPLQRDILNAIFWIGNAEKDIISTDKLIKYVTALDALLSQDRRDKSETVAKRYTAIMNQNSNGPEILDAYCRIKNYYIFRNNILHAGWRYIDPSILRSVLEDVRNLTFNLLLYVDSYKTVTELQEKIFPIRREVFEKTEKSNLCLDL